MFTVINILIAIYYDYDPTAFIKIGVIIIFNKFVI